MPAQKTTIELLACWVSEEKVEFCEHVARKAGSGSEGKRFCKLIMKERDRYHRWQLILWIALKPPDTHKASYQFCLFESPLCVIKERERNKRKIPNINSIDQSCMPLHYSHDFHPSYSGIISSKRSDFTDVVSNVARPCLANDEGPVFLNGYAGAARWIYDNVVLLPNIPDCHSISDH